MTEIIKIENLCKSFGDLKAVDDLSFSVKEGELFAFLGVNGAGKSTTISILCKTLKKDSGRIFIDGEDSDLNPNKVRKELGVVFQNSVLDGSLTVKDNLKHRASLYGIVGEEFEKRLKELASLLEFEKFLNRVVGKLSGGQRRKIDVARALLHKPKILILDEPTTGLDPQTRRTMWKVIDGLRKSNKMTVLLTTHYMEEAGDADYVLIIDGGKRVAEGTPIELKNKYTGDYITIYSVTKEQIERLGLPYQEVSGAYRLKVANTWVATNLIIENPELFKDYEITKGKMDDVFLTVTGKKLTEDSEK
ncbi:MAG: ABC transporter ATP-binding protein [Clostridia bacterium]|nr:ABC transporter ATP-binding protein [Clostridia bacterium]